MMRRNFGEATTKSSIVKLFQEFLEFINIGKTMSASQVAQTIDLIIEDHPSLSLIDLKLFFKRMKTGFYGTFYDRVDGMVVLEKLSAYVEEKQATHEELSISRHTVYKKEPEKINSAMSPELIENLKKATEGKPLDKLFKPKPPVVRTKTESELKIQEYIREFDQLFSESGSSKGGKFVKVNGVFLDINEFLELKLSSND